MARVAIIGAGIAGLACAHRLQALARESNRPLQLQIFEAGPRAGGIVRTRREHGFLWEEGPDSFITDRPWALDLCKRLGLEAELVGTNPKFQRSFVSWNGRLHPTPEGFYLLAPAKICPFLASSLFTWPGKMRMAMDLFLPAREKTEESLADFVRRRFGQEALERIAQPMVAGIYSADPETLSLNATFPRFLEMEKQHGSVIRALWRQRRSAGLARGASGPRYSLFMTLNDGLSALVEKLAAALPPGALRLNSPAGEVTPLERGYRLTVGQGEAVAADAVCVALPAPSAARVLQSLDADVGRRLSEIAYAPSATLHLAYPRSAIKHPLNGFGFVVPAKENKVFTGVSFSNVKFPGRAPEGFALFRAFLNVRRWADFFGAAENDIVADAHADLAAYLGITGQPLWAALWRRAEAMPQYTLGHLNRASALETALKNFPGLALAGNALRGLGLPDCVRSGEAAGEALWSYLTEQRRPLGLSA